MKIVNDTLESSWDNYDASDSSNKAQLRAIAKFLPKDLQIRISQIDTAMDSFAYFLTIWNICLDAVKKGILTPQLLYGHADDINSYEYTKQRHNIFYKLGYRIHISGDGDLTLTLPNKNAFTARWERLQSENRSLNLHPIDINSAKGVATDRQYILSFLLSDVL